MPTPSRVHEQLDWVQYRLTKLAKAIENKADKDYVVEARKDFEEQLETHEDTWRERLRQIELSSIYSSSPRGL